MSRYSALFAVSGYVEVEVEANSLEEATDLAYEKFDQEHNSMLESEEADLIEIDTLENIEKKKHSKTFN